jgi:hypothetical protein
MGTKTKKVSDEATRASVKKEMAKPRTAKSVRIAELNLERATKPLRDSQATPEARCAAVNFGLAVY